MSSARLPSSPAAATRATETYLANIPEPFRGALDALREKIRTISPEAEEAIVYGAPGFRLGGRPLVCYAAFKAHCAFYPMNPALLESLSGRLKNFRTSKGTIQFTPDHPLSDAIVELIVRRRVTENLSPATGKKS